MKFKRTRRILSFVLSLLLVLTLCTPTLAMAAEVETQSSDEVVIAVGDTTTLKVSGWSYYTTWESSDTDVATVSRKGVVMGIAPGTAIITAISKGFYFGKQTKTEFTVKVIEQEDSDAIQIKVGETTTLPVPSESGTTTWKSSDTSIATVSSEGIVTGLSKGTVTVTATTKSGGYKFWFFIWGETITTTKYTIVVIDDGEIPEPGKETFTVTFESNGGSAIEAQTVQEGDKVERPEDPTKEGYTFGGWYVDEELTTEYDFDVAVAEDITLYAKWEEVKESYIVTFETNGGSEVESQTVEEGQSAVRPENPTKEGCIFIGWYSDEELTTEYLFENEVVSNITLYAKWEEVVTPSDPDSSETEISLGTDIDVPSGDFEKEDAMPTFPSREDEISNIAEVNGGTTPYFQTDDNGIPSYIDGAFSDKMVNSVEDAIDALNDIHYIMGFENAKQEFVGVYTDSMDYGFQTNFYRLQQTYHNIPIYGYQLIVSTNENGNIQSLTGHYSPNIEVETSPVISMSQAKEIISNGTRTVKSDGLFVYVADKNYLVWKIRTLTRNYLVDAISGEIIESKSDLCEETINGSGTSVPERNNQSEILNFPVEHSNERYYLYDSKRSIRIADANFNDSLGTPISEETNDNWNAHSAAITTYSNIIKVFDFYANILGRDGADNAHREIYIDVNYRKNANNQFSNAFFNPSVSDRTFIAIGDGNNYPAALDVIAHEFTHAVTASIWGGIYEGESGALNESYSDIIGDLFEDGELNLHGEGLMSGANRNFANPSQPENPNAPSQPSNYSNVRVCSKSGHHSCDCGNTLDHNCDNQYVHYNSGITNHAAYLMDQNWPTTNHSEELATLFYYSMQYLTPNSNFMDCRHALLAASKSMKMSDEKRNVIATAMADVGIVPADEEAWASMHHIIGVVKDAQTQSPIIDAKIIAVATEGLGGGIGYSDGNGNYDVKVNRAVYTVSVFAEGYLKYEITNVDLSQWLTLNHYMDTIYLTPSALSDDTQNVFASGKITNALSGQALEGVTVKFRSGSNNQNGDYVQKVAGMDIELTTDSSGQYYTAALPAGNYTLEAAKDGYVTGYKNIISGNSEVCSNQNLSLTPELQAGEIRIVLEWGKNPRDMDSHLVGTLSNGNGFHVYYGYKDQYDEETKVCNLDVDDTDGEGPETITLIPTTSAPYYYYIYKYAGSGTTATSEARVTIYQGSNVLATFNVPTNQGDGDYWNVFAVVDGEIVVQNTVTSSAEISYADTSVHSVMALDLERDSVDNEPKKEEEIIKEFPIEEDATEEIEE